MNKKPEQKKLNRAYLRKIVGATILWMLPLIAIGLIGCLAGRSIVGALTVNNDGFIIVCLSLLVLLLALLPFRWVMSTMYRAGKLEMEADAMYPFTADALPAEEILVRAADEPPVVQSEVLLRAAQAGQVTPQEELLRVSQK